MIDCHYGQKVSCIVKKLPDIVWIAQVARHIFFRLQNYKKTMHHFHRMAVHNEGT
jgi:hypothetical protein